MKIVRVILPEDAEGGSLVKLTDSSGSIHYNMGVRIP